MESGTLIRKSHMTSYKLGINVGKIGKMDMDNVDEESRITLEKDSPCMYGLKPNTMPMKAAYIVWRPYFKR